MTRDELKQLSDETLENLKSFNNELINSVYDRIDENTDDIITINNTINYYNRPWKVCELVQENQDNNLFWSLSGNGLILNGEFYNPTTTYTQISITNIDPDILSRISYFRIFIQAGVTGNTNRPSISITGTRLNIIGLSINAGTHYYFNNVVIQLDAE